MTRTRLIIIISSIVLFFAALGIFFTVQDNTESVPALENTNQNPEFDFVKEDEVRADAEYFETFGSSKLKVATYGGPADIKTTTQGSNEYALIRNPKNSGGLDFVLSNDLGEYYIAKDSVGEKIIFTEGNPDARFGYTDVGEVSGKFIRERIPSAEYYAAYPISELAVKSNFEVVGDEGASSRFLGTKYLKITNLNNNRQVIVEIDSRNHIEDTLLISEATRKALLVDNNILGSFNLEIVDKENNTLGIVRL